MKIFKSFATIRRTEVIDTKIRGAAERLKKTKCVVLFYFSPVMLSTLIYICVYDKDDSTPTIR